MRLKVMRLDKVGISPEFSPDIKTYYFVTNENIEKLEVTAIPENEDATVTITGNENLQIGKNEIHIIVKSKDETEENEYIIYVTKTTNLEKANANLETLAIQDVILSPEFDSKVTNYEAEVGSDIENINLLAIPQKENAKVIIVGNETLKEGNNEIFINVLAEDGITEKQYNINVYKRSEEEEMIYKQNQEINAERLSAILEDGKANYEAIRVKNDDSELTAINNNNFANWGIFVAFVTFVTLGTFLLVTILSLKGHTWKKVKLKRNKNNKK